MKITGKICNTYKFSEYNNNKFYCWEKVFILMNIWMIGKNSMKHHGEKKKIFVAFWRRKMLLMQITHTKKQFVKVLE